MSLPAPAHDLLGTVIDGRYRIGRLIGHGGMGAVYEAEAIRLRRLCACKVLLPEFTRDEGAIARFEREAMAAARVDHPNVVKIHDTGRIPGGAGYIAMDLLRGESLDRTLRRERRLPWPRARHVAIQICRALAAAHAQGVVHRDLKPENCFRITQDGDQDFIKLVDFGIARLSDPGDEDPRRLTASNSIIGTYSYMAHEQVAGHDCDHRVDVWAAGVVLYEMLTGGLPFCGKNRGQILTAILTQTPAPMSSVAADAGIPEEVERIVAKALDKRPERRFASIDELAQALAGVDERGDVARSVALTLVPLSSMPSPAGVDAMASTVTRTRGPTGTEVADPYEITELDRKELRPTHASLSRGEALGAANDAVSVLRVPAPRSVAERRGLRQWLAASGVVVGAVAAALVVPAWAPPPIERSTEAEQSPAPSLHSLSHPVIAVSETVTRAPASEAPPVVRAPEDDASAAVEKPRKLSRPAKPRADGHAERVKRELARLSRSAGVRDCLAAHQPETLRAELEIDAMTGRVTRLAAQALMRGSALEKCIERESRSWRFSTGGPGDADYKTTQEFKLAP